MPARLEGMRIVTTAVYLPGPLAAHRLHALGAQVHKIEPPGGDPMQAASPDWYAALAGGQQVQRLDLKVADDRSTLDGLLAEADLLLTSSRLKALRNLGLDRDAVGARHPQLCQVAIIGHPQPDEDRPGHDLTYQARLDLLTPPQMPRTLIADIAGAQEAVSSALGLLLARERGQGAGYEEVSLERAAAPFADPWRYGATRPEGFLGGTTPSYGIYRAARGWVAIAGLEPHFAAGLQRALSLPELTREALETAIAGRDAAAWEAWAEAHDLPIVALPD